MDTVKVARKFRAAAFVLGMSVYILVIHVLKRFASWSDYAFARFISFERIDPDQGFAEVFIHHVIQMLIALVAILGLKPFQRGSIGFKHGD